MRVLISPRTAVACSCALAALVTPAAPADTAPFCADDSGASSCADLLRPLVAQGALSTGRRAALERYLSQPMPGVAKDCAAAWQQLVDTELESASGGYAYLATISRGAAHAAIPTSRVEACWEPLQPRWTQCCAPYTAAREDGADSESRCPRAPADRAACCAFGPGSTAHQAVPVLMEPTISLWLPAVSSCHGAVADARGAEVVELQQDGFLRPFDMPTVLWPAGYLLTEWIADSGQCDAWRGQRVLELGVGIGASAIAVARCGGTVVATDRAWRALALTAENAALAGLGERVEVVHYDWDGVATDQGGGAVEKVEAQSQARRVEWALATARDFAVRHGPFDAIIGAALQFETWEDRLWPTIVALASATSESAGDNGRERRSVTVALATTTGALSIPPSPPSSASPSVDWTLLERCSGDRFGMSDLRGGPSEFEVVHMRLKLAL